MRLDEEILQRYLDEDLDPAERAQVEALCAKDAAVKARVQEAKAFRLALRQAAPKVPSAKIWAGLQQRLQAQGAALPSPSLWQRFNALLTLPQLRVGFAAAAALAVVLVWKPWVQPLPGVSEPVASMDEAPAAPRAARRPQVAEAVAKASAPREARLSEVERALASQDIDAMIASALVRRRESAGAGALASRRDAQPTARRAAAPSAARAMSVDYEPSAAPASAEAEVMRPRPQGGIDANGFWDWRPAALAMNRRDWTAARGQLLGALRRAPEASERAFADSALALLAAPGAPLQGTDVPEQSAALRVQRAGRWQLGVENRVARFAGGVQARMDGLLSEGDALDLDLTFDRADFAPGTRFTRLSGQPVLVRDADGVQVEQNQFVAPRGASVKLSSGELQLR